MLKNANMICYGLHRVSVLQIRMRHRFVPDPLVFKLWFIEQFGQGRPAYSIPKDPAITHYDTFSNKCHNVRPDPRLFLPSISSTSLIVESEFIGGIVHGEDVFRRYSRLNVVYVVEDVAATGHKGLQILAYIFSNLPGGSTWQHML